MKKRGRIRIIGAPPCSGKSEVIKHFRQWKVDTSIEHEDVFTPMQRVLAARNAGIDLSSKEFVFGFNLPGQLAFQGMLRTLADQGLDVIGFGPFEDVTCEVDGMPLYKKMVEVDFAGYDFNLRYFLLDGPQDEVEEVVQTRLEDRANKSEYQPTLDADKLGVAGYYESRASKVRKSAEMFDLPLLKYGLEEQPESLAQRLADELAVS